MKKTKLFIGAVSLATFLAGCAAFPGHVTETQSQLDGEQQVQVQPGYLYLKGLESASFKVGGFWSDKDPQDFVLEVAYMGVASLKSLKVGIDGHVREFQPAHPTTDFEWEPDTGIAGVSAPSKAESRQRYIVPLAYVRQMVNGKRVVLQVQLHDGVVEGVFSFDQQEYARPGFRRALEKIGSRP